MDKPVLIIMCGYPYAGKTTLAKYLEKKLRFVRITIDDIVAEFGLPIEDQLSEEDWTRVYTEAETRLVNSLFKGQSTIFDATNGHQDYRDKLRQITSSFTVMSLIVFINTPLETIKFRANNVIGRHKATKVEETIKNFTVPTSKENTLVVESKWKNKRTVQLIRKKLSL